MSARRPSHIGRTRRCAPTHTNRFRQEIPHGRVWNPPLRPTKPPPLGEPKPVHPVSTGRGRPACRPAVRPTSGAHAGAPLPIPTGSGGKFHTGGFGTRPYAPQSLPLWGRCPRRGGEGPLSHGDNLPAPPEGEPNTMRQITHHVIARSEATRQSASPFGASRTVEKENGFRGRAIKPFLISPDSRGARHNSRTMGWHFRWISAMIGADHRPVR